MKLTDNLNGPCFEDGDLVTFSFDEATLTFRAPKVPYNRDTINIICQQTDFRNADTSQWRHFGEEGHCVKNLVKQNWNYEDSTSHDDIANVFLEFDVVKNSDAESESLFCLNTKSFRDFYLKELADHYKNREPNDQPYWPSKKNNFFAKTIKRDLIDGLQVQIDLGGGEKYPVPSAYFSLGRRYTLRIAFHFGSLHYSDRKNPYSEELLQQFKLDAFDDFLSHIRIEYSPETVALIEKLKENQS